MIHAGDRVFIKPQWQDPGDEVLHWVARCDEADGRVDISAEELRRFAIWPRQTVHTYMLDTKPTD